MNPTLCMVIVIAVLASAVFVLFRLWRKEKNMAKELREENRKKEADIAHLYRHAEELAEIKKNSGEEYRRLEDAKTDEEIAAVVAAVIAGNNGLCDGGKGRNGASSEAGEKETGAAGKHQGLCGNHCLL